MKITKDNENFKASMGVDGVLLLKHSKQTGDIFVVIDYPGESRSAIMLPFEEIALPLSEWLCETRRR